MHITYYTMPDNNYRMAFDFFFTNLPNHLEFLKWSRGLGRDDDILLVAALEAMHMHYYLLEQNPELREPRSILVQPQLWFQDVDQSPSNHLQRGQSQGLCTSSTCADPGMLKPMLEDKHPFNVIECYADLRKLDGHEYNVIEFAYLEGGWRNFTSIWDVVPQCTMKWWTDTNKLVWTAIVSVISQFLFNFILYFWYAITLPPVTPLDPIREDYAFQLVAIIAFISTIVFANIVMKQLRDAVDFNSIDSGDYWTTLRASEFAYWFGKILLWLNFFVNVILGPPLVLFNLYFVLTSAEPVDAILNAVALGFVLEVDDLLAPSWDDDMIEDAKAKLFHESISEPFPGDVDADLLNMRFTRVEPPGEIPYKDGDKLYIRVPEIIDGAREFDITVFRSNSVFEGGATPTETYQTITYNISGTANYVSVFHEKVRKFYCIQNYDDFTRHVERMERVEALRRKQH